MVKISPLAHSVLVSFWPGLLRLLQALRVETLFGCASPNDPEIES
jgi:hypothetical protein